MCPECWAKLESFHQFHDEVELARINFVKKSVKEEEEVSIEREVNCDDNELDVGILAVKVEPLHMIDADYEEPNYEYAEAEDMDNYSIQIDGLNDSHSDGAKANSPNVECEAEVEAAAAQIAAEIAQKTKEELLKNRQTTADKKFDHLISKYMEMMCEVCSHPFKTLTEAISHYRNEHNQRGVNVKCCERKLSLRDIRCHIQYHLNPDVFK